VANASLINKKQQQQLKNNEAFFIMNEMKWPLGNLFRYPSVFLHRSSWSSSFQC